MERISWDQYFMGQSVLLSLRNTCTRLTIGATIVRDKQVIARDYNDSASSGTHCISEGCYVVDNHCVRTIHAGMSATLQCAEFGVPAEGVEIYVTRFPCLQCTKMILQAGIKKVYYLRGYRNDTYALNLIEQVSTTVEEVTLVPKYFAELQWGEEFATLEDNPSSAEE